MPVWDEADAGDPEFDHAGPLDDADAIVTGMQRVDSARVDAGRSMISFGLTRTPPTV